jgi:hypothetical protein
MNSFTKSDFLAPLQVLEERLEVANLGLDLRPPAQLVQLLRFRLLEVAGVDPGLESI